MCQAPNSTNTHLAPIFPALDVQHIVFGRKFPLPDLHVQEFPGIPVFPISRWEIEKKVGIAEP